MSKTPPNRRGITFEVGAQLEARDSLKNWYAANIEKIDYEDEKVLIHYRQWSHRYDEWFDWTSPYLRPVERVQLRRQGLNDDAPIPTVKGIHVKPFIKEVNVNIQNQSCIHMCHLSPVDHIMSTISNTCFLKLPLCPADK
uniref:PHD finger protein 20-like protein 1 n=1 Tax=Scophthalmus maximus TaxID=52904 RepID=A0A8D3DJI5_SCOMX